MKITQYRLEDLPAKIEDTDTDISRILETTDDMIDVSEDHELTEKEKLSAKIMMPPTTKKHISMRIDDDIITWFKLHRGTRYQTEMQKVLKEYVIQEIQKNKVKA